MSKSLRNKCDCRYCADTKLFSCRNAAGLTAAKLAAKHGHVACAQLLSLLRKLGVSGMTGDGGRPSAPVVAVTATDEGVASAAAEERNDAAVVAIVEPPTTAVSGRDGTARSGRASVVMSVQPKAMLEAPNEDTSVEEKTKTSTRKKKSETRRCKSARFGDLSLANYHIRVAFYGLNTDQDRRFCQCALRAQIQTRKHDVYLKIGK